MNNNQFSQKSIKEIISNIENDSSNCFISVNSENNSDTNKLIALKDIHAVKGKKTTFGSALLQNYISPYDSTVVRLLKEKGYNIIGHTNLDEFAMGSTNKTSYFGGVDNALDSDFISGGSSGGSAVAVAKGLVPVATGTDTGGSIRQPAAFNGVYGMKPTYGLISRYGTFSFASSFDTIGVISNDIKDNANTLKDLAVNDEFDQTNFVPADFDPLKTLGDDIKGLKVAFFSKWLDEEGVDPEIKAGVEKYVNELKCLGCEIHPVDIPLTTYSYELYISLAYAEASSNLSRYDGIRFGEPSEEDAKNIYQSARRHFGIEVKKRLIIGTHMINSENAMKFYGHSQRLRNVICSEFDSVFSKYDIIIAPTTPILGIEKNSPSNSKASYLTDKFAIPANLTGIPAMNVPFGKAKNGLPIGVQIMADKYNENIIYQVAQKMEGKYE